MKIVPLLLAAGLLTACEPMLPFGDREDADFGEVDTMQAAPAAIVSGVSPIAGTNWLLATVGGPRQRPRESVSSASYGAPVTNVLIIDKESGVSVSLLPNERNFVRGHRLIWPVPGVVNGTSPDVEDGFPVPAPTHFMLDAELRGEGLRGRRLLLGGLDDFKSSLVARGYVAIHHMEMLDDTRLSILLGYPDRDELLIVDLAGDRIELRRWIDPARVAR